MTRHLKSYLIVPQFLRDFRLVHGYYIMKISQSLQFLVGPHLDQLFQNDDYQIVLDCCLHIQVYIFRNQTKRFCSTFQEI